MQARCNMDGELYSFQVLVWVPGNNKANSLFERGHWQEMARCVTKSRADEVALCLSLRHPAGVQAAQLLTDEAGARFVGYKYIPESAINLVAGRD